MASSYWKRRAERGMLYAQDQAEKRLVTIGKAMRDAQDYLTREAKSIFRTFANRFDLTEEQARAELARPITRAEYDRLVTRMATLPQGAERAALEVRANSGAYAYRISRAEALRENIAIETARVSQVVEDELTGQLRMTATDGYARRMYDLQQQTGNAFAVPDLDALRVATDTPWSGVSYSQRIWNDREKLAGALEETITSGYLSGKSHAKVARAIQERFGVSFREAERLVRTETSHISNQADLAAYRDAGIEQYEFDAALDSRTCPVCGRMDGQVFDVAKAETGENLPPMHPHCRCTTVMADKTKGLQRRGRDADGKSVLLPGDMTYEEWKQWQQAGAPADVQVWRAGLTDGQAQKAMARYRGAVGNEPVVSESVARVAQATGMQVEGFEHRVKTDVSYLRKVAAEYQNGAIDYQANDILRYTFTATPDKLVEKMQASVEEFSKLGYNTVVVKNTWLNVATPYKGINTVLVNTAGTRFELQYHTPESYALKSGELHRLYEQWRTAPAGTQLQRELQDRMIALSGRLTIPPGIERVK